MKTGVGFLIHRSREWVLDPWKSPAEFDALFGERADPWNYTSRVEEQERFSTANELLSCVCDTSFKRAAEIGCGSGLFTEHLATRCEHVLALDYSQAALNAAAPRLKAYANVKLQRWDLRHDALAGGLDLVVVMDVLAYLPRARDLRMAVAKLSGALRPGGHLLVTEVHPTHWLDRSRWLSALSRGAARVLSVCDTEMSLEQVARRETALHTVALYQRRHERRHRGHA